MWLWRWFINLFSRRHETPPGSGVFNGLGIHRMPIDLMPAQCLIRLHPDRTVEGDNVVALALDSRSAVWQASRDRAPGCAVL